MAICIIPARGGSKRIPRKNIKPFCGRPMILHAIDRAQNSGLFQRIILSSDDAEICDLARSAGAEVPFVRPDDLSDDHTGTVEVIAHATRTLHLDAQMPVCCLYATSPFVQGDDLARGARALDNADFVIPVTSFAFPIQRAVRRGQDGQITMFNPDHYQTRSQDLEEAYHDTGMFYWARTHSWQTLKSPFDGAVASIIIPRARVQDIDTPEDWDRAEAMYRALRLD